MKTASRCLWCGTPLNPGGAPGCSCLSASAPGAAGSGPDTVALRPGGPAPEDLAMFAGQPPPAAAAGVAVALRDGQHRRPRRRRKRLVAAAVAGVTAAVSAPLLAVHLLSGDGDPGKRPGRTEATGLAAPSYDPTASPTPAASDSPGLHTVQAPDRSTRTGLAHAPAPATTSPRTTSSPPPTSASPSTSTAESSKSRSRTTHSPSPSASTSASRSSGGGGLWLPGLR